jgi:hypothetical protein
LYVKTYNVTEDAAGYLPKNITKTFPNITFMPKTANEMKNRIKSLKSKLSCGYDGISTKLLQICTNYISIP